jgi:hypothetical protein
MKVNDRSIQIGMPQRVQINTKAGPVSESCRGSAQVAVFPGQVIELHEVHDAPSQLVTDVNAEFRGLMGKVCTIG